MSSPNTCAKKVLLFLEVSDYVPPPPLPATLVCRAFSYHYLRIRVLSNFTHSRPCEMYTFVSFPIYAFASLPFTRIRVHLPAHSRSYAFASIAYTHPRSVHYTHSRSEFLLLTHSRFYYKQCPVGSLYAHFIRVEPFAFTLSVFPCKRSCIILP